MTSGINALLRNRTDLTREQLERTRFLMNAHVRDALVIDFEPLIDGLSLPDHDDRHVLAAAIKGRADLIVTANLKHFPSSELGRWDIEARHPDAFLQHQFHQHQSAFIGALRTVRMRLRKPQLQAADYLNTLRQHGLWATASEIEPFSQLI